MLSSVFESMDLYIVSHGGVSSNSTIEYLRTKGLRIGMVNLEDEQRCVHFPLKIDLSVKCLYLYGDVVGSILSQYRRGFLWNNMNKIQLGLDDHVDRVDYLLHHFPHDPIGIKSQWARFMVYPNTVCLCYPFTSTELQSALQTLGFCHIFVDDMPIHPRMTKIDEYIIHDERLYRVLTPYLEWTFSYPDTLNVEILQHRAEEKRKRRIKENKMFCKK